MRYTQTEQVEALNKLKQWLKPGDTVHTVLRHKSRSGMSRSISAFATVDGQPMELDYFIAQAMGESIDRKHGGLRMTGCGMDMGFALVYNLSSRLFPDGFGCIGKGEPGSGVYCPSNDHSNGDREYHAHMECPPGRPHWHSSGGYALRHRWL